MLIAGVGMKQRVPVRKGETVRQHVERAMLQARGATIPKKPMFIERGSRILPDMPVEEEEGPEERTITVASEAKNG